MPSFNRSGGGMFDGIKSKLGFSDAGNDEYYDDYDAYADNFDGYSTYDDGADEGGEEYSSYAPVTTRSAGSNRPYRSSYSSRASSDFSGRRNASSHPPLVSLDDVRASTRVPDSLNRDPLPPRHRTPNSIGRNTVGHARDYALSGSEGGYDVDVDEREASQTRPLRSSGLDSLFSPSDRKSDEDGFAQPASEVGIARRPTRESSFDPYAAYETGAMGSHKPTRGLAILSPVSYSEVEGIAHSLKAGDVVILSLRNTPNNLAKRVLDFAFGVASALDASVDCEADKVFAITRFTGLSEEERTQLRGQGVL